MTIHLFALMSGLGVLLAQLSWNRQLLLLTGGSVDSAAAVLTAFMLGLGLGGRYFGKRAETSSNPVAVLRTAAAGAALCSFIPVLAMPLVRIIYSLLYSSGMQLPARFLISLMMVVPATFFAGGIVPSMARMVEGRGGTVRTSTLYGLNAIGSALGGFLAGFVLLELLGVTLTLVTGAVLTLVALSAVRPPGESMSGSSVRKASRQGKPGRFYLWLYFASGMTALSWETVWNRQLTFVLGNSTYAFATMGIMVLLGIGAGSMAARRFSVSASNPLAAFGVVHVLMGVASVIPLTALGDFVRLSARLQFLPGWNGRMLADVLTAFLYMIPSTALMGATFPLMVKAAAREDMLGSDVGHLFFANCMGAAAGPLLASHILFRFLGVTPAVLVLSMMNAVMGFIAISRKGRLSMALLAPAGAAVSFLLASGARPPGSSPPEGMELAYFSEGRTATVAVFRRDWDNHRSLRLNGVEEVPVDQASLEAFYLLGHLPWGYNPGAETAMAVALGGGITSGAILTHPVKSLVCVEICPEVVDAAQWFAEESGRPDLDPRFELVGDDGRNYLLGTDRHFDLIVCDATHPGSSESWLLYTEEFYSIVLNRLNPGGVAAQWVPLHRLPVEEFRRILVTWGRSFPYSAVHGAGGRHAILIGSRDSLMLDVDAMFSNPAAAMQLHSTGYRADEPFFLEPLLTGPDLASLIRGDISSNTDDRAYCQFLARKTTGDPQLTIGENMSLMLSLSDGVAYPVHSGQVLYWSMRLPEALEVFRGENPSTAIGRRWVSVSLSTAAELLYNEGRYEESLILAEMALSADSSWRRNYDLINELNRFVNDSQEGF